MDVVETTPEEYVPTLRYQFAKMLIATAAAFMAGKLAETAFDKIAEARRNRAIEETPENQ